MIDSVLKGTGNSRFLKSAVPAGTSWADALAMLQAGTFPIDFNGINTEGFQQVGTPLNKANLLKDATAAQIGLPPSTTPDGMFQALGNTGELHVWRKTAANGTGTYSLGAVQEGLHYIKWANYATSDSSVGTFEYGSEISVDNDGAITGIKNPSTITIKPWDDDVSKANVFKGKFIKMISQVETGMSSFKIGEIWWIPADAMMTTGLVNGAGNTRYIAASKRQQVVGVPAETTTTYPVSTNPNAYQEGDDAKAAGYVVGDVVTGEFLMSDRSNHAAVYVGTTLSANSDGTVNIVDYSVYGISNNSDGLTQARMTKGKYIRYEAQNGDFNAGDVWFIPSDASIEFVTNGIATNKRQPVTGYAAIPAGTTIEYLGKLGDKARVQVVSYVGTGTYDSGNETKIPVGFPPELLIVAMKDITRRTVYISVPRSGTGLYLSADGSLSIYGEMAATVSYVDGKVHILCSDSSGQMNASGYAYIAVAIG